MARKKDAEEDFASKAILDQLQTKTVSVPPSSTGLIGDQLPETVFDISDFNQVKNQVTLQLSNLELLNVLNTIGQITNTQSTSGPIVSTMKIVTASSDGSLVTIFRPDQGEVWEVNALSQTRTNATGSTTTAIYIYDGTNLVLIEELADNSGAFPLNVASAQPFRICRRSP